MWVRLPPRSVLHNRLAIKMVKTRVHRVDEFQRKPSEYVDKINTIPWSNGDDTCVTSRRRWFNSIRDHWKGLQAFRLHTSVVRTRIGFNSRADLCDWACMPKEATEPCKIGAMGSTPIRSTDINEMGSWSNGTTPARQVGNPGSTPGGSTDERRIRKVAGYGWPDRTANAALPRGR